MFVSKVDTAIRLENRGVTGLSAGLPQAVKTAAVGRNGNFKSKPMGPKGGIRNNVVHSSGKGIKPVTRVRGTLLYLL